MTIKEISIKQLKMHFEKEAKKILSKIKYGTIPDVINFELQIKIKEE